MNKKEWRSLTLAGLAEEIKKELKDTLLYGEVIDINTASKEELIVAAYFLGYSDGNLLGSVTQR